MANCQVATHPVQTKPTVNFVPVPSVDTLSPEPGSKTKAVAGLEDFDPIENKEKEEQQRRLSQSQPVPPMMMMNGQQPHMRPMLYNQMMVNSPQANMMSPQVMMRPQMMMNHTMSQPNLAFRPQMGYQSNGQLNMNGSMHQLNQDPFMGVHQRSPYQNSASQIIPQGDPFLPSSQQNLNNVNNNGNWAQFK